MKAFIVDDEKDSREIVKILLNQKFTEIEIVGEASNINEALLYLNQHEIDLLFLDIQLGTGTGFDILQGLNQINFEVIFITAYNQYAIDAIKSNALDYLLKPINRDEFNEAVQKAITHKNKNLNQMVDSLLKMMPNSSNPAVIQQSSDKKSITNKIVLLVGTVYELFSFDEIIRLKSDNNYTEFYISDKRKIITSKPLKYYEEILPSDIFLRVHQSHLVNFNYIKQVEKGKYSHLILSDGSSVEISLSRKEELFKMLGV